MGLVRTMGKWKYEPTLYQTRSDERAPNVHHFFRRDDDTVVRLQLGKAFHGYYSSPGLELVFVVFGEDIKNEYAYLNPLGPNVEVRLKSSGELASKSLSERRIVADNIVSVLRLAHLMPHTIGPPIERVTFGERFSHQLGLEN